MSIRLTRAKSINKPGIGYNHTKHLPTESPLKAYIMIQNEEKDGDNSISQFYKGKDI